jgi:hypothetical protein
VCWEGHDSSSKEEDNNESTEEGLTAGSFLLPGRPMKTTMETMVGTSTTESMAMMAPPATIVSETTAATAAAVTMMVMSVWFLQSSTASSQAPTDGMLASMYQADRLALGAIGPSLVMTPSFL